MDQSIVVESDAIERTASGGRRWRTVQEKRRIVEQTLVAGVSVAQVAREHRINANQLFQWRRQYRAGNLSVAEENTSKLLPVIISDEVTQPPDEEREQSANGAIHIEFPGRALVTIEAGADPALAGVVIERLVR